VADGSHLTVTAIVKGFSWTIQQTMFTSDMFLIPLGCCNIVLGIEWLVTLGNIVWNFYSVTMEFKAQGKRHVLRGASTPPIKSTKPQHSQRGFCYI